MTRLDKVPQERRLPAVETGEITSYNSTDGIQHTLNGNKPQRSAQYDRETGLGTIEERLVRLQHHRLHRPRERREGRRGDEKHRACGPGPGHQASGDGRCLLLDQERTGWMEPAPLSAFRCRRTTNTPTKVHTKENLIALLHYFL